MSSTSNLPFTSINPIKYIGLDHSYPFCSIVSQGKLIYSSGANIIMENTKNNEQKILFNNNYCGQIELIHHHVTLYNEHLLAIAIKESTTLMHVMVIIPLNPIIFNQESKKEKLYAYYLKNVEQFEQIKEMQFFDEGNLFAVITTYQSLSNLSLLRTSNGQVTFQESFIDTKLSIKNVCLDKINCMSILQYSSKGQVRLCLVVLDDLSRKFYFNLELEKQQTVIEYFYEGYTEYNILLALTNFGFISIYKVNQYQIVLINRVDVKQFKKSQKRQIELSQEKHDTYLKPISIQPANNKIVIAYEGSCVVGVLFYSHYNPKNTKFSLIEQALSGFNCLKEIKTIKMAQDNCSLAVLIQIYPQKIESKICTKESQEILSSNEHFTAFQINRYVHQTTTQADNILDISHISPKDQQNQEEQKQKKYIALQIDILSNMIDHEQQSFSTQQTFSLLSGHNTVIKAEYCPYNNTLFLLMKSKMIKYYDLTPRQHANQYQTNIPMYKEFKINGFLLWEKILNAQPHSLTVHPFNFTLLLIYDQILKFHYFNIKHLFPAFIMTSIKNCSLAKYSPLGDRIVLATSGAVIVLNSYTFEVMKTISIPNLVVSQPQFKRVSTLKQKIPVMINPKLITDFIFLKNGDIFVFSGHNSFSMVLNNQKAAHFGLLDLTQRQSFPQLIYDQVNNLVILLQQQKILVLAKSNLNTKSKCQVISKIDISASSAYLIQELGVLFVGGKDGVLYILKWPDYCQEELYMGANNKFHQFREPIISITVSANYRYIYTVSKTGSLCISQLEVNDDDENLPREIRTLLLTSSEKPLRQGNRWLISRSDEERKEREIIKLRGEQADIHNQHTLVIKKQQIHHEQMMNIKKIEMEAELARDIKDYQQKIGLRKKIQSIAHLRDQNKLIQTKLKRQIQDMKMEKQEKFKQIFGIRTKLQKEYKLRQEQNQKKKNIVIEANKKELDQLIKSFQHNKQLMLHTEDKSISNQNELKNQNKRYLSNLEEDHIEQIRLLNIQHKQEIQQLLDVNQSILSKNRCKNIEIRSFQEKIGELNLQKQKLQYDMYKVMDERQKYQSIRTKIIAENDHYKVIYDKLIKVSKDLEEKVYRERREQKNYEYKINLLEEQLSRLHQQDRALMEQRAKVNDHFLEQKDMNASRANTIIELTAKCQQLKNIKKEKHYQNCLLKNQYFQMIKTFMRNMEIDEQRAVQQICEEYKSPNFQKKKESVRNNEFQVLKAQHQKMANDALKWKDVKQSYMNSFYRNHKKLDQENLKLTYRYNDLLRLSQQYKIQISNLQESIQKVQKSSSEWKSLPKVSQSRVLESRLKPHFSFLNLHKQQPKQNKTNLKKKLICISLHQESGKFITEA